MDERTIRFLFASLPCDDERPAPARAALDDCLVIRGYLVPWDAAETLSLRYRDAGRAAETGATAAP
jgi:hypothetical protein